MKLLEVQGLSKSFVKRRNLLGIPAERTNAVKDLSLEVEVGETLALVGESGTGKSTAARLVLRLIEADSGTIVFDGVDLRALDRARLRAARRNMQMVFQDPYSSLDPRATIGQSIGEGLLVHFGTEARERRRRAAELLERVGLGSDMLDRLPSELSGGQLQRASIARALAVGPKLIVCDEPVAALDVSVRAQVLNLMAELQREFGIAYLFISHDLALVELIADRVAVMHSGTIVEEGFTKQIFGGPQHEYTRRLLAAVPVPIPRSLRIARAADAGPR